MNASTGLAWSPPARVRTDTAFALSRSPMTSM
jgi:hypothetical protein